MILNEVMKETADAIREKTGKSELIKPVDFAEEIKGITAGGGGSTEGDWEYYKFDLSVLGESAPEEEVAIMLMGLRIDVKRLVGDWITKEWRETIRGSAYDFMILEGGGDSYKGAIPQVALDLSQRTNVYKYDGISEGYTLRELLYADDTHPLFELLQIIRPMHPVYLMFSKFEKISKEEWERDDYTGVILD